MKALRLTLLCVPLASGCFVNIKVPLDTDLDRTELGAKVGESSAQSVLWLVFWGDSGTQAAAKQGGITVITHADRQIFTILFGIYARETTIVYGD
ncbi:MAG: TRL-like family protein [Myxococcota bacterium]